MITAAEHAVAMKGSERARSRHERTNLVSNMPYTVGTSRDPIIRYAVYTSNRYTPLVSQVVVEIAGLRGPGLVIFDNKGHRWLLFGLDKNRHEGRPAHR